MLNKGYIAFTSLLVVSAISLAVVVAVSLLGVNESRNSLDYKKSIETQKVAESCAEEALLRTKNESNYSSGSLLVGNGECSINVSGDGENVTIVVEAQIDSPENYVSKLEIVATKKGGGIVITRWTQI